MSEPAHDLRMTVPEFLRWDDGTETALRAGGRPSRGDGAGQAISMAESRSSAALEMRRRLDERAALHAPMTEAGDLDQ